jgi:hypothetical protein
MQDGFNTFISAAKNLSAKAVPEISFIHKICRVELTIYCVWR